MARNLARLFAVRAARDTGEWLSNPKYTGRRVDLKTWGKKPDTSRTARETFEHAIPGTDEASETETCAVVITWVK